MTDPATTLALADRACCCPAQPVVMAVLPPSSTRPASVDLLLCGHHYQANRHLLTDAGATVHDARLVPASPAPLPGTALAAEPGRAI
jgi:hypothetical protein